MSLIKDLLERKCAIEHTGTVEELREVLIAIFPNDRSSAIATGEYKYYLSLISNEMWTFSHAIPLEMKSYSVNLFLDELRGNEKMYTIKDLAEGRVAVANTGTLEQLREVLRAAFPEERVSNSTLGGVYRFYHKGALSGWISKNETNLPTQRVQDFINQFNKDYHPLAKERLDWIPQWGELVEARTDEANEYVLRTFLALTTGGLFVCEDEDFRIEKYIQIRRPLPVVEISLEEIAEKFDIEVSQVKIVGENGL